MVKALKVIGMILLPLIVMAAGGMWYLYSNATADAMARFLRDNPDRSTIQLVRNDSVLIARGADRMMPLASTVKIIIAIEYARQATSGDIDPNEWLDTIALEPYYIPQTDGGAHPAWLRAMASAGKLKGGKVTLREVARGMIDYSSNANSEYLMTRLGLEKINAGFPSLGIVSHEPLYPFVSALYVFQEKPDSLIKTMTLDEYRNTCRAVHTELPRRYSQLRKSFKMLPLKTQRIWSDRLPASTAREYAALMKKINDRTFFGDTLQLYLDEVMEGLLNNPANRKWLKHAGTKGGSTASLLTQALYATSLTGDKTELAYFLNGLSVWESLQLQAAMNDFNLKILTEPASRRTFVKMLSTP